MIGAAQSLAQLVGKAGGYLLGGKVVQQQFDYLHALGKLPARRATLLVVIQLLLQPNSSLAAALYYY